MSIYATSLLTWMSWNEPIGCPNCFRSFAQPIARSSARSAMPVVPTATHARCLTASRGEEEGAAREVSRAFDRARGAGGDIILLILCFVCKLKVKDPLENL